MFRRVPLITFANFRLPDLQLTHIRRRYALRPMHDEIVPDSEPEREEQRRNLDEERRVRRTRRRPVPEHTRSMPVVPSSSPEPDLGEPFVLFSLLLG